MSVRLDSKPTTSILDKDLQHFWHPCSQMKDYEDFSPLIIKKALGSYLELDNGKKVIDAISSWWCKSLGHRHPRLQSAIINQISNFEHVISANTTNEVIVDLSEKLAQIVPPLNKVFYAGDGSSSVEIAMKISLQSRHITKEINRTHFIGLENGYHGDTTGAMSVSDVGIFKDPYKSILFETTLIKGIPYVSGKNDPLWKDCSSHWQKIKKQLEPLSKKTTALILEPIVQGAGGIKVYSPDFIRRLRKWTEENNIHLIADEIMTGIGRTGKMLACEHAGVIPDLACVSKGLTSGWLPFSAVLIHENIYNLFYDDYKLGKNFLHSHTYSGNVLGARLALETLRIIEEEKILDRVETLEKILLQNMIQVSEITGKLTNIRNLGGIVAADIVGNQSERLGFKLFKIASELGALLRPIENTIYWLPPLNIEENTLEELKEITVSSLKKLKI